jgi:hypothetical protein
MQLLPVKPPVKVTPRADHQLLQYVQQIYSDGVYAIWQQAAECPCRQRAQEILPGSPGPSTAWGREPRPDCPVCAGMGYYLHSEQEIRLLVLGVQRHAQIPGSNAVAEYADGECYLTTLPEHVPSYLDRFTLRDSVVVYRETAQRREVSPGVGETISATRYPIRSQTYTLLTGPGGAPQSVVVNVLALQSTQEDGSTEPGLQLVRGVDFTVTQDGRIDWTLGDVTGKAPPPGGWYGISYYCRPVYVVIDHPHPLRDVFVQLKSPTESFVRLTILARARLEFLGLKV